MFLSTTNRIKRGTNPGAISSALAQELPSGLRQAGRQAKPRQPPQTLDCGASRTGTSQLTGALLLLGSQAEQTEEH